VGVSGLASRKYTLLGVYGPFFQSTQAIWYRQTADILGTIWKEWKKYEVR